MTFTITSGPLAQKPKLSYPLIEIKYKDLPSKGISYKSGDCIRYRPYTFGEIKAVSQSKLSNKEMMKVLIDGIYADFDVGLITLSDIMYIGLLRNVSSLGTSKFKSVFKCQNCTKQIEKVCDVQDIEFKEIEAEASPIGFDSQFGHLSFHPLTFDEFCKLAEQDDADNDFVALAYQAEGKTPEQALEIIEKLYADDIEALSIIDELLYHGLQPIAYECTHCNHKGEFEPVGGQALIVPFREHKESNKNRIQYGTPSTHKPK